MCDLNRISAFLITIKVTYGLILGGLGIAAVASSSLFAAAGATGVMLGLIALMAVINFALRSIIEEINKCSVGQCSQEFANLVGPLNWLQASMIAFTAALIGLTVVAAIPFAGAVAIGVVLTAFAILTVAVSGGAEYQFAQNAQAFNVCKQSYGEQGLNEWVVLTPYFVMAMGLLFGIGAGASIGNTAPPPK